MVTYIMDYGMIINQMEMENMFIKMEIYMKEK